MGYFLKAAFCVEEAGAKMRKILKPT